MKLPPARQISAERVESMRAELEAFTGDVPLYVALVHGQGCQCSSKPLPAVVGPFINPHPNALLGWAQAECSAGVVARMLRPSSAARTVAGAR